jgi:hypothetical protein
MRLTPKRVERLLHAWSAVTAPAREGQFTFSLAVFVLFTIAGLISRNWWWAIAGLVLTLVTLRLLWELPGSRVRRVLEALKRQRDRQS